MTFVDRVFLKWCSGTALAAAFTGSNLWFAVVCLPLGICTYTNTFVSQYFGNGQATMIGRAVWQGAWAGLVMSPFVLAFIPIAPSMFALAGHETSTYLQETAYFQILLCGAPAMLLAQALCSFYSGRGQTSVVMCIDVLAAAINVVLDYLWIFGRGGFPVLGITGAGWATVTALWFKAFAYVFLILRRRHRGEFGTLEGLVFDRRLLGRLLYFGGPSGLQMLLDVLGFAIFILLIGRLGDVASQASSIAFSISTLAFMPIWGIGLAVGILVGQRLGEDRDDLAARSTQTGLVIAMNYMAIISVLYVLVPEWFLSTFFAGAEATHLDIEVRTLAATLLRFVAAYNLFDAVSMVFVNAIKGAGDTPFLIRVSFVMAIMLAGSSWIGVEVFQFGILGCWAILTAWVWTLGVVFWCRYRQGKWRTMRVIEPSLS